MRTTVRETLFSNVMLDPNRQREMVFYGRVSTQHEAQLAALENQMKWYEDQMKYHQIGIWLSDILMKELRGRLPQKGRNLSGCWRMPKKEDLI